MYPYSGLRLQQTCGFEFRRRRNGEGWPPPWANVATHQPQSRRIRCPWSCCKQCQSKDGENRSQPRRADSPTNKTPCSFTSGLHRWRLKARRGGMGHREVWSPHKTETSLDSMRQTETVHTPEETRGAAFDIFPRCRGSSAGRATD
jgi:hypothetical protein